MDWSEYIDLPGEVLNAFKVESFPTYIVLDKDGVIRFRQSGLGDSTQGDLEDAINKALKRESDPKLAAAATAGEQPASAPSGPVKASGAAPSATASAKPDAAPASPYSGIEGGIVSGNIYKNAALGMTLPFPQGWVTTNAESLHALNERTEAGAKAAILQQHPELANSLNLSVPKTVFYASRKGEWDGQRIAIPSIHISAIPSRLDELNLDAFQQMVANRTIATGMKLVNPAAEFRVNKHQFVRADFERSVGTLRIYQSFVQTVAGDYLVTIEIYAYSTDELQQVAAFLQSVSITEEDK